MCVCTSFTSSLSLHLSRCLSVSAYIKIGVRARLCGPPSGGGPRHFMNFHSRRSFQVGQAREKQKKQKKRRAERVRAERYLGSHPRRAVTSLQLAVVQTRWSLRNYNPPLWGVGGCFVGTVWCLHSTALDFVWHWREIWKPFFFFIYQCYDKSLVMTWIMNCLWGLWKARCVTA